jgi:hypothetical protein
MMRRLVVSTFVLLLSCAPRTSAPLVAGGVEASVDATGVDLAIGDVHGSIALRAIGRDGDVRRAPITSSARLADEAQLVREGLPGIVEWWRRDANGLEHGVTIANRPRGDGHLVLDLAVLGLSPRTIDDDAIALDHDGAPLASYAGLIVRDAAGVRIDASMRAHDDAIVIDVDDRDAIYPLVVDPTLTFEARLIRAGAPSDGAAAVHVRMNADATRALVGYRNPTSGASIGIHSFARNGTLWATEGLVVSGADLFALSADGATVAVITGNALAIYTLSAGAWSQVGSFASVCTNGAPTSIGISGDGHYVIFSSSSSGCVYTMGAQGSAVVYSNATGSWGASGTITGALGVTSVDATGTRITGGRGDVYVRSGTGWSTEFLAPPNYAAGALTPDGSRMVVAHTQSSPGTSVFVRSGTSWSLEAINFGISSAVAISADGSRAYVADPSTGNAFLIQRSGTTWTNTGSVCNGVGTSTGVDLSVSADGGRVVIGALLGSGDDAVVCRTSDATGTPCSSNANCASGACVDGFCCNNACGGSTSDCIACASPQTGVMNGICAPLSPSTAPSVTCRPAAGACDVAEVCLAGNPLCPTDAFSNGTFCRAALGPCDVPDVCPGNSATCPDAFVAAGMTCRFAVDVCDVAETCSGTSAACPTDVLAAAGTMCRPGTGTCDPADTCTGTTTGCPAVFASATTECRAAVSSCDVAETCTGATPECPPDAFEPASHVCAPSSGGVCDAPDVCSGTSAVCVPTFLTGFVCRTAVSACDVAEVCSGTSANCPPDGVLGAGVVCRVATAPCDPVETCDGTSMTCPPNVDHCGAMPDGGGVDAGPPSIDAATSDARTSDATTNDASAAPPPAPASCGCRVGSARSNAWMWLALLALSTCRRSRRSLGR